MFRICDSETVEVLFETTDIQKLSEYLYDKQMKYITVSRNQEYIDKCLISKD